MKTNKILICLFTLLIAAKTYAQSDMEVVAVDLPDSSIKENPGIEWRKISVKELTAVQHIEELIPDAKQEKLEVVSFKVTFDGDNVPYFEYDVKGNEFSEAVLGNISKSGEGTKIMIGSVKATMPGGVERLLNPVNLIITE